MGGGPFGAASAVEGGEVELVDFHGVVGAPHGVGGFHERLDDLRGAGGRVVVARAYAALGVLELQYVAVFFAVMHDFGILAVVLVHGVPPTFVVVVALEVFFCFCIAVHADFAVFEVDKRDGVAGPLRGLCEGGRSGKQGGAYISFHIVSMY